MYAGFLGSLFAEPHSGQKLAKATVPPKAPQGLLGLWNDLIRDRSLTSLQGSDVFPDTFLLLQEIIANNCDWIKPLIIGAARGWLELMHKSYTISLAASQNMQNCIFKSFSLLDIFFLKAFCTGGTLFQVCLLDSLYYGSLMM